MTKANITISKKKRNNIFHHLGLPIPYNLGKKCGEFTIYLGKAGHKSGKGVSEFSYEGGRTIGSAINVISVKVVDKSEDQLPMQQRNNGKTKKA